MITKIKQATKFLGITYPIISIVKHVQSQAEANETLKYFKDIVKKQRKILAMKYHPDVCDDKEKMKMINAPCDFLLLLNFNYQPQVVRQYVYYYSETTHYGTTAYF